jgi:hypothetical protein
MTLADLLCALLVLLKLHQLHALHVNDLPCGRPASGDGDSKEKHRQHLIINRGLIIGLQI